jgi:hypothetical protein
MQRVMPTLRPKFVVLLIEMSSTHGRGLIRGVAEYPQRQTDWLLPLTETGPLLAALSSSGSSDHFGGLCSLAQSPFLTGTRLLGRPRSSRVSRLRPSS